MAGDNPAYLPSGDASHTLKVAKEIGALSYAGPASEDYHDAFVAKALFHDSQGGAPIVGRTISFQLGATDTCTGMTGPNGMAACIMTPTQASGSYPMKVSFTGDEFYEKADDSFPFTIDKEETSAVFASAPPVQIVFNSDLALSGHLSEDGAPPLAARTLTFKIGSGPTAQTCTTPPTDAAGNAGCTIAIVQQSSAGQVLRVSFSGDAFYAGSTSATKIQVISAQSNAKSVLDSIDALIRGASKEDRAKLADAAAKLRNALVPANWADDNRLVPKRGDDVFDDLRDAVGPLLELLDRSGIPASELRPLIDRLVETATVLADVALADAVAARGDAAKIAQARAERSSADASLREGRILDGIVHLGRAWHRAEEALNRL